MPQILERPTIGTGSDDLASDRSVTDRYTDIFPDIKSIKTFSLINPKSFKPLDWFDSLPQAGLGSEFLDGIRAAIENDAIPLTIRGTDCSTDLNVQIKSSAFRSRHSRGAGDDDLIHDSPNFRPRQLEDFAKRGFRSTIKMPSIKRQS